MAMAKQMPCAGAMIAVLTPITSPCDGDQRPAGVARVERRVGLDHVVDQRARVGAQRPAEGADDAGGDGRLEAERVADGDDELPDAQARESPSRAGDEVGRVDAHDREVGVRIVADELCREVAPVGQRDAERVGAVDDVAVGQDEAVAREEEAGARAGVAGSGGLGTAPRARSAGRPRRRRRGLRRRPRLTSRLTTDGPTSSAARMTARE